MNPTADGGGTDTVSREHGRTIREIIEKLLIIKEAKITIDFSSLSIVSPSFINEAFVKMARESLKSIKW